MSTGPEEQRDGAQALVHAASDAPGPMTDDVDTGAPVPPAHGEAGEHDDDQPRPAVRGRRGVVWGVVVVVVVLVGISLAMPAGRHQWALAFVRQPTHTTTLAFEHPATLPSSAVSGAPVALAFTVANQEGRDLRYRYVVTSGSEGQAPAVLEQGVVAVPSGARRSVSVRVVPRCSAFPCRVQVALPGPAETIDVRLDLHAAGH